MCDVYTHHPLKSVDDVCRFHLEDDKKEAKKGERRKKKKIYLIIQ
jgi:hypothetical protein